MAARDNRPEFTVSELSSALKRTVEDAYGYVRLRGEVAGFKRAGSGHLYFRLKDEDAVIDAVVWRGNAGKLSFNPEDGLEVIATGKVTTYAARSSYQIVCDRLEPAGAGALMALLEERRKKLAAEGLFDPERKQRLPYLPDVIGIVTSPTGAVIRDMLHRLAERFPRRVLLYPVLVQGESAAGQIAAAIDGFSKLPAGNPLLPRPDVLIVARGGGSLEDLWAFNEDVVVRAAASCTIPLISAVGHETDTTLIDHAADRRAPTPTAAAEMAVPVKAELELALAEDNGRLAASVDRFLRSHGQNLDGLKRGLPDPDSLLAFASQRLDSQAERLPLALRALIERQRARIDGLLARLGTPAGYVREASGRVDGAVRQLSAAARALIRDKAAEERRVGERLSLREIEARLPRLTQRLDELAERQDARIDLRLSEAGNRLASAVKLLESYSYKGTLARGFALVRDPADALIPDRASAEGKPRLVLEFRDGPLEVLQSGAAAPARKRGGQSGQAGQSGKSGKPGDQPSLL